MSIKISINRILRVLYYQRKERDREGDRERQTDRQTDRENEKWRKKWGEQHGLAYMPPVARCQNSRGMRSTRSLRYRLKVGRDSSIKFTIFPISLFQFYKSACREGLRIRRRSGARTDGKRGQLWMGYVGWR